MSKYIKKQQESISEENESDALRESLEKYSQKNGLQSDYSSEQFGQVMELILEGLTKKQKELFDNQYQTCNFQLYVFQKSYCLSLQDKLGKQIFYVQKKY